MTFVLGAAFVVTICAAAVLFVNERRRGTLQIIAEPSRLPWIVAAAALLLGSFCLASIVLGGVSRTQTAKTVSVRKPAAKPRPAVTTVIQPVRPKPKKAIKPRKTPRPAKPKPRPPKKTVKKPHRTQVVRQQRPVAPKTVTIRQPPPPPPATTTVLRSITTNPAKPRPKPKPKAKPKPKPPKVIAPFVWVMARVTKGTIGLKVNVKLREYRGSDVVGLKTIRSGATYRYYYKHKADQLCQVIKPGTTATSPVCVQIIGGSQVIIFTSSQA